MTVTGRAGYLADVPSQTGAFQPVHIIAWCGGWTQTFCAQTRSTEDGSFSLRIASWYLINEGKIYLTTDSYRACPVVSFRPGTAFHIDALQGGPSVTGCALTPQTSLTPMPACTPSLISPLAGALLDNGRTDRADGITWGFEWSECPAVDWYQLHVTHVGAANPYINDWNVFGLGYQHSVNAYISDSNRSNWVWKVRAWLGGRWGEWSESRPFDVEPVNTDQP